MSINNQPVLIILPATSFDDDEYQAIRKALDEKRRNPVVTSTVENNARGNNGTLVQPDLLIDDVNPDDYQAVVLVGGHGASQFWHDRKVHDIIRTINNAGKAVAAIDRAPVSLGIAGIIKGKKVTGHISVFDKLINYGAKYTGEKVERDGNILTGEGANASSLFANALENVLNGNG